MPEAAAEAAALAVPFAAAPEPPPDPHAAEIEAKMSIAGTATRPRTGGMGAAAYSNGGRFTTGSFDRPNQHVFNSG